MIRANLRDLVAGGLLLGAGLFFGLYSMASYSMDTLSRIGPGMFPVSVGFIIAALGVAIALIALRSHGPRWPCLIEFSYPEALVGAFRPAHSMSRDPADVVTRSQLKAWL